MKRCVLAVACVALAACGGPPEACTRNDRPGPENSVSTGGTPIVTGPADCTAPTSAVNNGTGIMCTSASGTASIYFNAGDSVTALQPGRSMPARVSNARSVGGNFSVGGTDAFGVTITERTSTTPGKREFVVDGLSCGNGEGLRANAFVVTLPAQ